MSWQGQMSTIVRHLIDDLDPTNYKYSDHRVETAILVSAQLTTMNVDFANSYTINVESCTLSPDPTDSNWYHPSLFKVKSQCTSALVQSSRFPVMP